MCFARLIVILVLRHFPEAYYLCVVSTGVTWKYTVIFVKKFPFFLYQNDMNDVRACAAVFFLSIMFVAICIHLQRNTFFQRKVFWIALSY